MKNNPLNGYQPDHDEEIAANAAHSAPETDAANIDPDTGEIIASTDAAADTNKETTPPRLLPDLPLLRETITPRRPVRKSRSCKRGGDHALRLFRRSAVSRRSRKEETPRGKYQKVASTPL